MTWRLLLLAAAMMVALGALGARLYYLTVVRGRYFYELSENNFLYMRPIPAVRGRLLAADGTVLSLNRTFYRIEMSPLRMKPEQIRETIDRLADLLGRPEIRDKSEAVIRSRPRWKSVTLIEGIELEAIVPAFERLYRIPGVMIEPHYRRHHPHGSLLGQITGYIRQVSPATLEKYPEKGYLRTDLQGKSGAERHYEALLRGVHGEEILIRDALGRARSSYVERQAVRGRDIVLTIDLELQRRADDLLRGHSGVAIIMDPRTGAILALASKPDYDPNHPLRGSADGSTSMYNKATRGLYAPASAFKIVTAATGLVHGKLPAEQGFCEGHFRLPNIRRPFYCDVRSGHGWLDMETAIQRSCNVYFYRWASQLGADRMIQTARAFGFGERTGIDLGSESRGRLARPGVDSIYTGSVVQMGIGQGALILVTPLQLLAAYGALANGGVRMQPHLLAQVRDRRGRVIERFEPRALGELPLTAPQRRSLIEGFRRVIQRRRGTAWDKGFKMEWDPAGKTGSAEVAGQKQTNGWFVAFAPASAPEIAVIALIENEGHGGATAVPIVRDLMDAYFQRPRVPPDTMPDSSSSPQTDLAMTVSEP